MELTKTIVNNLTIMENPSEDDDNSGDCSDDGLKIVIDSPQSKRKINALTIGPEEKEIIESVENEIEKTLEEKAAKTNLSTSNVKNILKHVVTNEHVLAMVRQAEDPDNSKESVSLYEPKLTRAKAKELFSTKTVVAPIPWLTPPKPPPEVQALITEDLAEDSSDDEYIPIEEESEDDRESSVFSENGPPSIDSATPAKNIDSSTQTNWCEEGIFKLPLVKSREEDTEEANIALRTRSKLCLSSTPLEIIEEAFIPPDITTDMYDMDCDDDVWKDFLKKFTRPLDEVIRHAEDEDHDPEYNVLADEEIDKVDKEELREDKGVKVTRRELNKLIAELFDYADNFTTNSQAKEVEIDLQPQFTVLDSQNTEQTEQDNSLNNNSTDISKPSQEEEQVAVKVIMEPQVVMIEQMQILLLEQQMRQHVQLLTQSFLLSYDHPEYSELADKCKEYLYNLKYLPGDKEGSYFVASNLHSAIKLIEDWQKKFNSDDNEVKTTRKFVARVLAESIQSKSAGIEYIPTFPPLIFETISKSDVFLYPWLLPRIPFKSSTLFTSNEFTNPEDELIALGLEQFMTFLKGDSFHMTPKGEVRLPHVCHYIQRYMVPVKNVTRIYKHVSASRNLRNEQNPIKFYFENKRAPATLHYVVTLDQLGTVPPCQRKSTYLPYQWRQYLYPNEQNLPTYVAVPIYPSNITKVLKPPAFNKSFVSKKIFTPSNNNNKKGSPINKSIFSAKNRIKTERRFSSDSDSSFQKFVKSNIHSSTPKCRPRKLEHYFNSPYQKEQTLNNNPDIRLKNLKFNSSIFEKLKQPKNDIKSSVMLPSMPSLNTPIKRSPEPSCSASKSDVDVNKIFLNDLNKEIEGGNIKKKDEVAVNVEKDNLDDLNALMIASTTIPTATKRKLSGAEKKKAKLRKEQKANMLLLSPEDPSVIQEKTNMLIQAFYDKLQEHLDIDEFHSLQEILNEFDENSESVLDLYHAVNKILDPKYPDLMEEFLMFLTSAQAKSIGKYLPHLILSNMSLFLRKLEMYFKEQPAQVRKIYRGLTELSNCADVTMDKVKSTILPLLKGNVLLRDWFLQIFPCEKPPKSLLDGPWETIEMGRENISVPGGDIFETIVLPDVEDPYGGPNCICSCHNVEDQTFKNKLRHCVPCGTKFIQGRLYIPTEKGLRPAKITFNNPYHYERLSQKPTTTQQKKKTDSHATKRISPSKDNPDEIRMSNESEDDTEHGKKRQSKSAKKPRQRKSPKKTEKPAKNTKEKAATTAAQKSVTCDITKTVKNDKDSSYSKKLSPEKIEPVPSCSGLQQKKSNIDLMEWDCNTSIESLELELHLSPGVVSENEENLQGNKTSNNVASLKKLKNPPASLIQIENNCNSEELSWTRDEDKVILETLQKQGNREETFVHIAQLLENRPIRRIKARFQTLMSLLQAMAAESAS